MPLEALAEDENLEVLEAGQEGEEVLNSAEELDGPDAKPRKKGKAKAPPKKGSKKVSAEEASSWPTQLASAQSSMEVWSLTMPLAEWSRCIGAAISGAARCLYSCSISCSARETSATLHWMIPL